jgi:hypothetical protein
LQVLVFAERLENPSLNSSLTYTQEHDITLYGSTAPGVPLGWEGCQYGCDSCPTHSYCTLLVNESLRKRTVKCKAGKQFCSGVSLAAVDVLKYKGFQLIVITASTFDTLLLSLYRHQEITI